MAHVNDLAFVGSTLVRTQRSLGVDATLVLPWRPGARLRYPWKAAALPFRAAAIVGAGLRLRAMAPDLGHVHYARLGMLGWLSGRPFVVHCHGTDVRGVRPGTPWGREVAPILRAARAVYYATPDLGPDVHAFRHDAVFIPNPIDLPPERAVDPAPSVDLLVGARLEPIKGVDTIAEIVGRVLGARPDTSITILDQGPDVAKVVAAAGERGHLIAPVPHDEVPALVRRHRLVIGQVRVGALGNFELEALAAGRPVAASFRHPEAYDVAPPVVDGGSAADVADRIVGLLDDEPARAELGALGRRWVHGHHDPLTIATDLVAEYARILSS
ncbi:MAG TPA: glycosyltransferase family 4 protein [Candidatus Binatus sp.]|nr:glycosyltransferase family 4 protein [Candidatus Binatus sp.]